MQTLRLWMITLLILPIWTSSGRADEPQELFTNLQRNDLFVYVRFSKTAPQSEIDEIIRTHGLQLEHTGRDDWTALYRIGVQQAEVLIPVLNQNALIEFATPVFTSPLSGDPPYFGYTDEIIVKFHDNVSEAEITALNQRLGTIRKRQARHGDWLLKVQSPKVRDAITTVRLYNQEAIVQQASVNTFALHTSRVIPGDEKFPEQWNLHQDPADADIDAPEAWDITKGSESVIIAIIDSGIDINSSDRNKGSLSGNSAVIT